MGYLWYLYQKWKVEPNQTTWTLVYSRGFEKPLEARLWLLKNTAFDPAKDVGRGDWQIVQIPSDVTPLKQFLVWVMGRDISLKATNSMSNEPYEIIPESGIYRCPVCDQTFEDWHDCPAVEADEDEETDEGDEPDIDEVLAQAALQRYTICPICEEQVFYKDLENHNH